MYQHILRVVWLRYLWPFAEANTQRHLRRSWVYRYLCRVPFWRNAFASNTSRSCQFLHARTSRDLCHSSRRHWSWPHRQWQAWTRNWRDRGIRLPRMWHLAKWTSWRCQSRTRLSSCDRKPERGPHKGRVHLSPDTCPLPDPLVRTLSAIVPKEGSAPRETLPRLHSSKALSAEAVSTFFLIAIIIC